MTCTLSINTLSFFFDDKYLYLSSPQSDNSFSLRKDKMCFWYGNVEKVVRGSQLPNATNVDSQFLLYARGDHIQPNLFT